MSYTNLWKTIFPKHYKEKYKHPSGLSGGGGDYPVYDIHLSDKFIFPEMGEKNHQSLSKINLRPNQCVLAVSEEYFDVPKNILLLTHNKSTIARMFIDASFNTLIDNKFQGYLTIEIKNHSNNSVILEAGQPILKVRSQSVMFLCKGYDGKYQNQPDQPVNAILEN